MLRREKFDPAKVGRWLAGTLGWAGCAILLAVFGYALWVTHPLYLGDQPSPLDLSVANGFWGLSLIVAALLGGYVWNLALARGEAASGSEATGTDTGTETGTGRSGGGRPSRRRIGVLLAFVALALAVVVLAFPAEALPGGLPRAGEEASAVAIGRWSVSVLVALAGLSLLGTLVKPAGRLWSRSLVGLCAGFLAVVLVGALVEPAARYRPVERSAMVAVSDQPPEVPADVTRVGWTWEPPAATGIQDVAAGTHGPVVVLGDGLVSLDGETGEERWSYRMPGESSRLTGNVGGGTHAHLVHQGSGVERVTVLDTATGQVLREAEMPRLHNTLSEDPNHHLTPDTRLIQHWEDGELTLSAYALDEADSSSEGDAEPAWERVPVTDDPDRTCGYLPSQGTSGQPFPVLDLAGDAAEDPSALVAVALVCADRSDQGGKSPSAYLNNVPHPDSLVFVLSALDVAGGEEVWRQEWSAKREKRPKIDLGLAVSPAEDDPLVLVGDRAFAPRTGEELGGSPERPSGLDPDHGYLYHLSADTTGALAMERDWADPNVLLHRMDPDGTVIDTTTVEGSKEQIGVPDEGLVLPEAFVTEAQRYGDEEGQRVILVAPLGADAEEYRLIEHETAGPRLSGKMAVVPGAVVMYDKNVQGLVP